MPYYSQDAEPTQYLKDSYCKMLLLEKLLQLHYGKTVFESRSALSMAFLLHFTSRSTLQDIKNASDSYIKLCKAIDGIVDVDDEDVMDKRPQNKIQTLLNHHTEKEYVPRGDMPVIIQLIEDKDLIDRVNDLSQTYL